MSAGTVVITGGILAAVILLCIVAVLCYCRLQYYCCRRNDSELDVGSVAGGEPHGHFACNACSALAMDGTVVPAVSLDRLEQPGGPGGPPANRCPTCSPYGARPGLSQDARNGGERLGFHTYYENPSASMQLSVNALSYYGPTDLFPPPPRPYSTPV